MISVQCVTLYGANAVLILPAGKSSDATGPIHRGYLAADGQRAKGRRLAKRWSLIALLGVAVLLTSARAGLAQNAPAADTSMHWVGTWAVSPQTQETPANQVAVSPTFNNQTLREIVHTSVGGKRVRVRFTNQFGIVPMVIGTASVGLHAGNGELVAGSYRALTFSGRSSVTIAPGALVVSDVVSLDVPALSDLAISIYLPNVVQGTTTHAIGSQTNYLASGDQTTAPSPDITLTTTSYYFVRSVEVLAPRSVAAVVCLGDSITDGSLSVTDSNGRWPNILAQRLLTKAASGFQLGVLDQGIGGNCLLHHLVGPDMLSRFDADVVAQAGVTHLILLAGINDIGFSDSLPDGPVSSDDIIAAYRQIIVRAHDAGLLVHGGTLLPFNGAFYYSDAGEQKRAAVNNFIRTSGEFDGVIDFEAALRDTSTPPRLQTQYDCGDHLHPNNAGYAAMADAVKLKPFKSAK